MAMMTVHCPVARADVVRVADLEGATLRVICTDYDAPSRVCKAKLRAREGGPLGRLFERADGRLLASRGTRCELA
jgi:hypothetical protein